MSAVGVVLTAVRLVWKGLDQAAKGSLYHAAHSTTRLVPDLPGLRESVKPILEVGNTMHEETARAVITLALREMGR